MVFFADVALHLPMEQLFTYSIPEAWVGKVVPGIRVRVPFQSRQLPGTCLEVHERIPSFKVRPILGLLGDRPPFDRRMLRVCSFLARRYGAAVGEVLDAALPVAVRKGGAQKTVRHARLKIDRAEVERTVLSLQEKHPKQARALRILGEASEPLDVRRLASLAKVTEAPVTSLVKRGYIEIVHAAQEPDELDIAVDLEPDKALTDHQARALERLSNAIDTRAYRGFLLFGVTGSGKTEVYLQALRRVIEQGRQGIVLVPEIALTPQTVARFKARFPRVAVLHSNLTDAERHRQWRTIQSGAIDVVVGARSAIFAPFPNLGLVVVDEEHEGTFKQQNSPRYDAREAARARARIERAVLVLGSATPSIETYARARSGRLEMLRLPARVGGGAFPETFLADLRQTQHVPGRSRVLTDRLRAGLIQVHARKEQSILFLNRRGYATAAICRTCGGPIECKNCDIVLVYHRKIGRILCHYCGHEEVLPSSCTECQGPFRLAGFGTERIEEEVRQFMPDARCARMDSDTMRARGAHDVVLSKFRRGEIDVLIGTQMIAKGLDFPNVTLVGIVAADSTLHLPDYRAAERTFSLVAQVAGRAGRGEKSGLVIVQTQSPDHFAIKLAVRHDYERFAETELEARKRDGYPPFGQLARVVVQGPDEEQVIEAARALREHVEKESEGCGELLAILGPAPAPLAVLNEQHRHHIVAKAAYRSVLRVFVKAVKSAPNPKGAIRTLLDVDPWAML